MELVLAEQKYWFSEVRNKLVELEDFTYPDEATLGVLKGTDNQEYIDDDVKYPVLRWREIEKAIARG